ncbi:unnamed protein product [Linum tenue]|uniref:beta-carotene 3-hydroxylase n=1 Tax=Linum tenue TaxID=586396 RepID=A0AAV0MFF8_9ROSI|nr:unnamed protein product [Linum tenue]
MASSSVLGPFSVPLKHHNHWSGRINNPSCWIKQSISSWKKRGKQMSRSRNLAAAAAINEADSKIVIRRRSSSSSSLSKEGRFARKEAERLAYLVAALLSSVGVTFTAAMAVFSRFSWQLEGGEFPVAEMLGTFALSIGAAVGMEFWARWAHRALWHDSLWDVHESHHRARREGAFEANDVFAITNAVPAIGLLSYGFFNKGLLPGLCFGAGLGITVFGMAYMFVHDGLTHRRFPVGPIANVPYLRRVAAAHQLHHADKFDGVPYGLFLGPEELAEVGGTDELEKEVQRRIKRSV